MKYNKLLSHIINPDVKIYKFRPLFFKIQFTDNQFNNDRQSAFIQIVLISF